MFYKLRIGLFGMVLLLSQTLLAMPKDPVLVDYVLSGKGTDIYFEPSDLNLKTKQPYLFLINNPFNETVNLLLGDLGKNVHTYYINGVPGFSQSSMLIPAQTKVTWVLDFKKAGNFKVTPMHMGLGQKGQASVIAVHDKDQPQAAYTQEELAHFEQLKKSLEEKGALQKLAQNDVDANKASRKRSAKRLVGGRPD